MTSRRVPSWVAIALVSVTIFLPRLGSYSLWNPDEPRYALVAREMAEAGDPLLPRLNGEPYTQKPPLLFWAIQISAAVTGGFGETAARLPSALAAIGTALLVVALGRRLFSERAGWIAAIALVTSVKILWQGRVGQIDMLLTFLVALAVWAWVRSREEGEERWVWLFWGSTALGTIAKGPVALLPALLSILVFLAIRRDREGLRRLRLKRGFLLYTGIVLVWLLPAVLLVGRWYFDALVLRQVVTRAVDPWHHFHSWHYYIGATAANYFPWTIFLPTAAYVGWRELRGEGRTGGLFVACWAVVTIVFFSLSPAKRDVYVLPMYPAMALAIGAALDRLIDVWPRRRRWLEAPLLVVAAIAFAAAIAAPRIFSRWEDLLALVPGLPTGVAITLALLGLGAATGWVLARLDRPVPAIGSLCAATVVVGFLLTVVLVPKLEPFRSLRPVAEVVAKRIPPDEPVGMYPRLEAPIVFYSGREATVLETEEELREFVARPGPDWVVIRGRELEDLEPRPVDAVPINEKGSRPYFLWEEGT